MTNDLCINGPMKGKSFVIAFNLAPILAELEERPPQGDCGGRVKGGTIPNRAIGPAYS